MKRFFVVLALTGCIPVTVPSTNEVRLVLFGDSNTDYAYESGWIPVATSYISNQPMYGRVGPDDNHHPLQLAGLVESVWRSMQTETLRVVNHAIGGTNTGYGWGPTGGKGPNARQEVDGVSRFEAEILGIGYPWEANGIERVNAFVPTSKDFAYVSLGTNDCRYGLSYDSTIVNLRWMAEQWVSRGLPSRHFLLATIGPTTNQPDCSPLAVNEKIRGLAAELGLTLIDLAAHTTADGIHWLDPSMSTSPPDDVHYTAKVRQWIAWHIVETMRSDRATSAFD